VTIEAPARGWVSLYALAFVLLLAAVACVALAGRDFLQDLTLLKASAALSVAAIVLAVVSVVLPKRR
jgi:hypothetical protein